MMDGNLNSRPMAFEPTFFGKVMAYFAVAVLSSAAGALVSATFLLTLFLSSPALMYVVFALELILVFTSRMWTQRKPLNQLLLVLFAFLSGITVGPLVGVLLAAPGGVLIIGKALFISTAVFLAMAITGATTGRDLSGLGGFLMASLLGIILVSIVNIFIPWGSTGEMIFAGFGIVLFSAMAMYDFQKLKHYPADNAVGAAITLYLDFFNLLLFVLRFLTASSRD